MPSWPIHLAIANKINKKLQLGDEFIIGNVLPDVLSGFEISNPSQIIAKDINHFQDKNKKPPRISINKFTNKYKIFFNQPLIKGYLAHLLTDKYFNEYTYKNHYFYDQNKFKSILNDGTILDNCHERPWQIKQSDFKIFDQKLINDNMMPLVNSDIKNISLISECPIDEKDLNKVINKINSFAFNINKYERNNYRMFTEEELSDLYEKCYKYVLNKLKTL